MDTATTRELILKIATGNYTDEELAAFLEAVKVMDRTSFMAAYQLLYEEINKYPAEELAPGFKDRLEKRLDALETVPFRRKWWTYAGAAAAVLVFFIAGYFLLTTPKRPSP